MSDIVVKLVRGIVKFAPISAARGQKNLDFGILAVWSWDWNGRPRSANRSTCSVQLNTVSLEFFLFLLRFQRLGAKRI